MPPLERMVCQAEHSQPGKKIFSLTTYLSRPADHCFEYYATCDYSCGRSGEPCTYLITSWKYSYGNEQANTGKETNIKRAIKIHKKNQIKIKKNKGIRAVPLAIYTHSRAKHAITT